MTEERAKIALARYLVSNLKSSVFPGFRILGCASSRLLAEVTFRQQGSSVIPWRCYLSFHALDQSDNVLQLSTIRCKNTFGRTPALDVSARRHVTSALA